MRVAVDTEVHAADATNPSAADTLDGAVAGAVAVGVAVGADDVAGAGDASV